MYQLTEAKEIVGNSSAMQRVNYLIEKIAEKDVDCLLLGETGTGKEIIAQAIHSRSKRKDGPFVVVNCSSLSENLVESELFGHVKGAFTGAIKDKAGKLEIANGGTLFLDEIGELSLHTQVKLLRFLQERQIERVGDSRIRSLDIRVIAATHRNLETMINEGKFREDLYYRLKIFPIVLPPLRERNNDIPLLAEYFIKRYQKICGAPSSISPEAIDALCDYSWPGNVRELENAIQYALVLCENNMIEPGNLPESVVKERLTIAKQPDTKEGLLAALEEAKGNRSKAAKILGISRITVWHRMKKYGLLTITTKKPAGKLLKIPQNVISYAKGANF